MISVDAPRFDLDECNNDQERQFIEVIHARSVAGGWFADSWPMNDRVMLSVCPMDHECNLVLRTLRIDFDGTTVWFGPDETHQFATDLDPSRRGVYMLSGKPIGELAHAAADWLEQEMSRPILRKEWDTPEHLGIPRRLWVLADTGEAIVGTIPEPFGPPDREVIVSDIPPVRQ